LLICVPHKALLAITSMFLSGPGKLDSVVWVMSCMKL
jgi:hypothetical protein